jgi:hypothetical protein
MNLHLSLVWTIGEKYDPKMNSDYGRSKNKLHWRLTMKFTYKLFLIVKFLDYGGSILLKTYNEIYFFFIFINTMKYTYNIPIGEF